MKEIVEKLSRKILAIVIFGSYVYNPNKADDIDVIVVINELKDINDKIEMEIEISKRLRKVFIKNVDVHVFDISSFKENLKVGTFLTGFVLGYKVVYDAAGLEEEIRKFIREIGKEEDYVYIKRRRWNLTTIARAKNT
ncbi:MAG: nucleotidyltransferase domain-containing protein [Thermoprotei archaeon]|jgi:predicted nucleotidyltransferase